jgi:hypothetical protein
VNYTDLRLQFERSPTLRLLRAENAPLVLTVLFEAFKREHRPTISENKIRFLLEAALEELRDLGQSPIAKTTREYLIEWADMEHGYLRRFQPPDAEEPCYELTPEIERAFQWLESLRPRPYVGTESKFKNLVMTLEEIVENSVGEPDLRVKRLRAEQQQIQEQINQIEESGAAPVYTATQINERFATLLDIARQLLGDFREVERHFRKVTEDIGVRQSESGTTRGGIVSQTLDAQDQLRGSSQGQSFYAFWEFLLDPERRREFGELVELAYQLPALHEDFRADSLLRSLQRHLRAEGIKVLESNKRLVAQLRRILDVRQSAERREVGRFVQEIKHLAHETRYLQAHTELVDIESPLFLNSVMSKAPWSPPTSVDFGDDLQLDVGGDDPEIWKSFLRLQSIDFARLRRNIQECLQARVQVSLSELLLAYPPRNGILEVLAYLVIAETDGPHVVFDDFDVLDLSGATGRKFRVPQVVFSNT